MDVALKDHRRFRKAPLALTMLVLGALGGCGRTPEPTPEFVPQVVLIEAELPPRSLKPELPPLFDDIERRTFQFFWDTTNETNGLTPDRYPSRPFASIASVGFALTAYPIGIEKGWVSRNQAIDRTLLTLKFFRDLPVGPQRTGKGAYKGSITTSWICSRAAATTAGWSFPAWIRRCC